MPGGIPGRTGDRRIRPAARASPSGLTEKKEYAIMLYIGFPQLPDKLVFAGVTERNTFPRGEGAPVRTLGRMRNGDMFRICLQFVKKVHWERLYRLN